MPAPHSEPGRGHQPVLQPGDRQASPSSRKLLWGPELRLVWVPTLPCDPQVSNSRPSIPCSLCITNSQSLPGMEAPRLASAVRADSSSGAEKALFRSAQIPCRAFRNSTLWMFPEPYSPWGLGSNKPCPGTLMAWTSRGWSNSAEDRTVCTGAHGHTPRPGLSQESFLEEAPCPLSSPERGDEPGNDTQDTPASPQNSSGAYRTLHSRCKIVATSTAFAKIPSATQR